MMLLLNDSSIGTIRNIKKTSHENMIVFSIYVLSELRKNQEESFYGHICDFIVDWRTCPVFVWNECYVRRSDQGFRWQAGKNSGKTDIKSD